MEKIRQVIERIDFRWDKGFIDPEEYDEKRAQLEADLEALHPLDYDELIEAADLIEHFESYWEQFEKPEEARQQLLSKIVERVFVHDGQMLAVVLHGDFGVVLGQDNANQAEVAQAIENKPIDHKTP